MAEGIRVNPSLIPVACNRVVSVSWDGRINIMLGNLLQLPERLGGGPMFWAGCYKNAKFDRSRLHHRGPTAFGNFAPHFVYDHEIAHCNGWTHGPDGNNMNNLFPPKEFVHKPSMKLIVKRGTTKETTKICKEVGSYACQWFE